MRKQDMHDKPDLSQKELDIEAVATQALADERILPELLDGISPESKKNIIRTNSFNTLLILAKQHPEVLFPRWDYLVELLQSNNGFSQYPAIHLIAALAPSDDAQRFEAIFDTFYSLLNDKSVMVAGHVAGVSGQIATAKPHLQTKITERLLTIDDTHHEQERKDLIKARAIESMDAYFETTEKKDDIIAFVRAQLDCASPKTRKVAKTFLKKWKC
jgi:hypothetical protein